MRKKLCSCTLVAASLWLLTLPVAVQAQRPASQEPLQPRHVDFSQVRITDRFWLPRLERHAMFTLPVCIDQIENQTGRISNFAHAAERQGEHSGIYFDDSDVYKAMEGMAYSLMIHPDKAVEEKLDHWTELIERSQWDDGYINTFYTLTDTDRRWTDMDRHEMYCMGHLIEAGVAYYQATGKRRLLDVCCRVADHLDSTFGPSKRQWVPGHEEVELALCKLYTATGTERYLRLAHWLLEERGRGHGSHVESDWNGWLWDKVYHQDDVPVSQLRNAGGHAVRLMYLLCGMADVSSLLPDADYSEALHALWQDVTERNMYITGGIGSSQHNEGFTEDYDLPNETAYCETCASIGLVLWSQRMHELTGESRYIDVMERTLYNALLAGINLRGDRFFYVNPLSSAGEHHRQAWYGCACCPSNVSRFLPSLGSYVYGTSSQDVWVHLYIGSETTLPATDGSQTSIRMQTDYPWNGDVSLQLRGKGWKEKTLRLRIPGWCTDYSVRINGKRCKEIDTEKGYAVLRRKWKDGDTVTLTLDMPVRLTSAAPQVKADAGMRAIERGPIVYCAEAADNTLKIDNLQLTDNTVITLGPTLPSLDSLQTLQAKTPDGLLTLIPYYAWDNRAAGKMRVWIPFMQ